MDLFKSFKKTIFLKKESDLEKQLVELKRIREKLDNKDEIDRDIKLFEYGIYGENRIIYELNNADIGMYVLHDVTFECDGNKAQIDFLLITRGCFYLIECKNLIGNITVDSNGQFYREYNYKGRKIKESIYSPYTQAERHQEMLKKVWAANHSFLENVFIGNFHGKDFFRPIVVLSNSKGFLNTKYAPKEIKNDIIRVDQLVNYLKNDIKNTSYFELLREKDLKKTAEIWLSRSVPNDTNILKKYLKQYRESNNNLEKTLRSFRRERTKKLNFRREDYIFSDTEMYNLIKYRPKTLDELKKLRILADIRFKCHGEEIIKVLNSENNNK